MTLLALLNLIDDNNVYFISKTDRWGTVPTRKTVFKTFQLMRKWILSSKLLTRTALSFSQWPIVSLYRELLLSSAAIQIKKLNVINYMQPICSQYPGVFKIKISLLIFASTLLFVYIFQLFELLWSMTIWCETHVMWCLRLLLKKSKFTFWFHNAYYNDFVFHVKDFHNTTASYLS
jgi:hypothetical protein